MKDSRTDIDRLFEQGVSDVSHTPRKTMSVEQIAASSASKSGVGILLLSHAKEILLCIFSFLVGVGETLFFVHRTGNRDTAPTETVATIPTDTANTARSVEDTIAYTGKTTVNAVSAKPASNVSRPKSPVSSPVVVKKTVVQRDTVVINETVTLKDTVYVP